MISRHLRRCFATFPKLTSYNQVKSIPAAKLSNEEVDELLNQFSLFLWRSGKHQSHCDLDHDGHLPSEDKSSHHLSKTFHFKDGKYAFAFMDNVAVVAEQMDHHPEWRLVDSEVDVKLRTHDTDSVSYKDVLLARTMDYVCRTLKKQELNYSIPNQYLDLDTVFAKSTSEGHLTSLRDMEKKRKEEQAKSGERINIMPTKCYVVQKKSGTTLPKDKKNNKDESIYYEHGTQL